MATYETGKKIVCPMGPRHETIMEELPEGYATKRWPEAVADGSRLEEPYLRCPVCTATFPKRGIEEYLADK